jgi:hypothetical protein
MISGVASGIAKGTARQAIIVRRLFSEQADRKADRLYFG